VTSLSTLYGLTRLGLRLALHRLRPGPPAGVTLRRRLAMLPTEGLPLESTLTIRWNGHQVPYVEAASDRDLAVGLGLVHAHLRLAQIELMRRIAEGRLAEFAGPVAIEFDRVLRILEVDLAADAMVDALSPAERAWIEGFADGLNAYVAHLQAQGRKAWPHEFRLLGIAPEPWRPRDLMAIARLAATDFTWRVWIRLLKLRDRADWAEIWQRLMGSTLVPVPGFTGGGGALAGLDEALLDEALASLSRQGSNSAAVAGSHTTSGGAMIASDPHLGITLPNLWLIAGWRSPSYRAVGLMIPGVPVLALGRNRQIAWGGTSLHAASSDLFALNDEDRASIVERRQRIKVRWGRDRDIVVRHSRQGPIISDAPLLLGRRPRGARRETLALRWIGHRPSDEVGAMLGVARATCWQEFLAALEGFAVPAQNMIYADAAGRVGQAMAAQLPRRPLAPPDEMVAGRAAAAHWESLVSASALPRLEEPGQAFVASANNRPAGGEVAVGHFFSPDDRVRRLRRLLGTPEKKGLPDLARLQQDVTMERAKYFAGRLAALLPEPRTPLARALAEWDGVYAVDSAGALAFELVAGQLIVALHGRQATAVYAATWDGWALLAEDLEKSEPARLKAALAEAIERAAPVFQRLGRWGEAHRLQLSHFLGRAPLIGRRYRFADLPSAGGNETLMKAAHGFAFDRHAVRYGANARHLSDLADPDANHFVLLGGQDGWLGSTTWLDQLPLWREGRYVQMPLSAPAVAEQFPLVTVHLPAAEAARC